MKKYHLKDNTAQAGHKQDRQSDLFSSEKKHRLQCDDGGREVSLEPP